MTKLRRRHAAAVVAIGALAAAGCGSSSSKSKPAAPALTPSATETTTTPAAGFSGQLSSLCKEATAAGQSAGQNLQKLATIAERFLPKFEALTPPASQKALYAKFVANSKAEIAAAKKNDVATIKKLNAQDKTLAAELNAPDCE